MPDLKVIGPKPVKSLDEMLDHLEEVRQMVLDGKINGIAIAIPTNERGATFRYVGNHIVSLIGSTSLMLDELMAEGREGML